MELDGDKGLLVRFYSRPVINETKSYGAVVRDNDNRVLETIKGAGRPIVDDVDFIEIRIPTVAYSDSIVDRPVMYCGGPVPEDKTTVEGACIREGQPLSCDVHRFWKKWQAYAAGKSQHAEGTDLKDWSAITRGQAEELAHLRIYTVEQLASLNDSNVQGQWVQLRQRARDYLEQSKKQVTASELGERDRIIKQQGDELAEMKRQMAAQAAQMQELLAASAPKAEKNKPNTKGA